MLWIFAIIVVLLLGAVVVVAAGHGDGLAPTYDDRRDVLLPTTRDLGPEDLRSVRFTMSVWGYRTSEVDALVARLEAQLAAARQQAPQQAVEPAPEQAIEPPVEPTTEPSTESTSAPESTDHPVTETPEVADRGDDH
ncbi:DivIVA domain-containing protein [Nocardioides sp.]|uniref:DivIVA domain-containing protein n=1 Tax=Nocardioides sp. TaxID=35761 RepID=UPI00262C2C11|nr:DivIVA domain-containing protein [Nocardioides sp.]